MKREDSLPIEKRLLKLLASEGEWKLLISRMDTLEKFMFKTLSQSSSSESINEESEEKVEEQS